MRARRDPIVLATLALLVAVAATGCGAAHMVGLGGAKPAAPPVAAAEPATPDGAKPAKPRKHKDARGTERERARSLDPVGEAREHATEQPTEPFWPYRVAELEAKSGHREASEAALRDALAREPGYAPALTSISKLLYVQGRHEEAVALLAPVRDGSVVMDEDDRAAAMAGLALHEAALGHDDRASAAMGALEKSGGTHPEGSGGALAVSAFLAVRGTDNKAALALTARAVSAAPKSAASHNNRGIALLRAADPDAAEKEFEKAIALDPTLPGPYYNLAILERFYRMDTDQATKHFQRYWAHSHADPDSLYAELGRGKPASVAEEGNPR